MTIPFLYFTSRLQLLFVRKPHLVMMGKVGQPVDGDFKVSIKSRLEDAFWLDC